MITRGPPSLPEGKRTTSPFTAKLGDLVVDRNFGRVAVQRAAKPERRYRFALSIEGQSRAVNQLFELNLDANPIAPPPPPSALPAGIAAGDLIRSPEEPTVYLIENGARRSVADEATFLKRWKWNQVKMVPAATIAAIPRGSDLPSIVLAAGVANGDVIKSPDDPAVYLIENRVRRWVPDEPTFLVRWAWDQVKHVPAEIVNAIPRGRDLPSVRAPLPPGVREGDLIKSPDQPAVYFIENRVRRSAVDEATFLVRWTWDQVKTVPAETVNAIPRGHDLPSVWMPLPAGIAEGDLIRSPDQPAVYFIEKRVRRWVPDEAAFLARWTWDRVKTVPAVTLDAIPRGRDLPSIRK